MKTPESEPVGSGALPENQAPQGADSMQRMARPNLRRATRELNRWLRESEYMLEEPNPVTADELKSGPVTYEQCERMVALAEKWLLEYFADGLPRRPGDLEDDFAGEPGMFEMMSNIQGRWRTTPFYPALGRLVSAEKILFETDADGNVWYALPGCLPSTKQVSANGGTHARP